MLNITRTNALLVVSPVNHRILPYLINTQAWMTRLLLSEDSFETL